MIRRLLFAAMLAVNVCHAAESKCDFFANPERLLSDEIREQFASKALDMCWHFGEGDFFRFISKKDEVYFEIVFDHLPSFYDEMTTNRFIERTDSEGKRYSIFSYEWRKDDQFVVNYPREHEKRDSNTPHYLIDTRRIIKESHPQPLNEAQLLSIITNNRVLFYTGAGLSVASGVPSMSQLYELLELKGVKEFAASLQEAIQHPEKFSQKILGFHNACFLSQPTKAHQALVRLAFYKNTKIVTENLDGLHEYSGIMPYRVDPEELRSIGGDSLSAIDYIICIGLSQDDRGFLGWYKRNNPTGQIISVDLGSPSYLGDEDFLIHADLQILIPSLEASLGNQLFVLQK
jgi:NAD-dependent SIR2 family protein deacetylase